VTLDDDMHRTVTLPGERFHGRNAARVTTWGRTIGETAPGDYMNQLFVLYVSITDW